MWRFTLERSLMRKETAAIIKVSIVHGGGWAGLEGVPANASSSSCFCQLPPEDVKDFLEQVAAPRVNRGWEFLLPTDGDFVRKHPDVAHRQHMLWVGIQSK